jgi:hypothetical protein
LCGEASLLPMVRTAEFTCSGTRTFVIRPAHVLRIDCTTDGGHFVGLSDGFTRSPGFPDRTSSCVRPSSGN